MSAETLTLRVEAPSDRAALIRAAARRRMTPAGLLVEGLVLRAELEIMARAGGAPSEARAEALTARMRAVEDGAGGPTFDAGGRITLTLAAPEDRADLARAALQAGRAPGDWAQEVLSDCLLPFETADLAAWARAGRPAPHPHWRASERLARLDAGRAPAPSGAPDLLDTELWVLALFREVTDKAGAPYFDHLDRVAEAHDRLFPHAPEEETHAAWLHDVIEDCGVTEAEILARGYAPAVARIVAAVTKTGPAPYGEWVAGIAASGDAGAMRVKIADLSDNADPARLARLDEADAARLRAKYAGAAETLRAALSALS
ncbi:HD domain-containing protein [Rhodovulum sp. DZ06]|uniref:HD domain-containing protein n=1 Tax=Rhodovulum sp. DZ06 TaxID=3425126 RepID=UPI003D3427A4